MNEFIKHLATKKAHYYHVLYKSGKRAERKEECLARVRMLDEYVLLLDIIEYLPMDLKEQLDTEYNKQLDRKG